MELTELCQELKNWFDVKRIFGRFEVSEGEISLPDLQNKQYFRIVGSVFNDGVHQYQATNLKDESFEGAVWYMAVPPTVLNLLDEINQWQETYGGVVNSPYSSESFGGYSYTKKSGSSSNTVDSSDYNWRTAFADRLNRWRKV